MPGAGGDVSRTGLPKRWQLFQRANESGRKESTSGLTFFLGGAADEAAFARDAGTRDGGQRYWGGEEGDGHVCGRVCGVKAGRDRCYPWWVKSVKISKISLPIFHFPV